MKRTFQFYRVLSVFLWFLLYGFVCVSSYNNILTLVTQDRIEEETMVLINFKLLI